MGCLPVLSTRGGMNLLLTRRHLLVGACALPLSTLPGCATMGGFGFEDAIRRLLTLSSQRAFARLLVENGFFEDELARVLLPPPVRAPSALRSCARRPSRTGCSGS